jgi:hypothetical protein
MKNPIPLLSKAHLTNFNLNNFKMTEAIDYKLLHQGLFPYSGIMKGVPTLFRR